MAQFDLHRYGKHKRSVRYVLDVQSDLLGSLATCVVIPIIGLKRGHRPIQGLNPVVEIEGSNYYLSTAEMAAIHRRELGERVGSLADRRRDILAAIDLLFTGI